VNGLMDAQTHKHNASISYWWGSIINTKKGRNGFNDLNVTSHRQHKLSCVERNEWAQRSTKKFVNCCF